MLTLSLCRDVKVDVVREKNDVISDRGEILCRDGFVLASPPRPSRR